MSRVPAGRSERCEECGRRPDEDENYLDGWRCLSDGCGALLTFCPACAWREFQVPPRRFSESSAGDAAK